MKALIRIAFCCVLTVTVIEAQRGGGMGRGGFSGGGFRGGFGGFHGGFGGVHGGFGFRGNRAVFVNRGFGGWGWPAWGWGGGPAYWPSSYWAGGYDPYGYGDYYLPGYGYGYGASPNVVVVYPQAQAVAAPIYYYQPSQPVIRENDGYGQEIVLSWRTSNTRSPTYLIALKNHVIYDAVSYSVKGDTIYFVTIANEQKSSPMIMVDRGLSIRLNWERQVNFQLP